MRRRGNAIKRTCLAALALLSSAAFAERTLFPGDRVRISCPEYTDLCVERTLTVSGSIQLPGLPSLNLAKCTSADAAKLVAELLIQTARCGDPTVTVAFLPARNHRASIVGLVRVPGDIFVGPDTTLQSALAEAQPSVGADLHRVTVFTAEGQELTLDAGGKPWRLHAGDRIEVSTLADNPEVFVVGGVAKPGVVPFSAGMTVGDAIRLAGGVGAHGQAAGWRLRHAGEDVPISAAETTVLQVGDTLEIPLSADRNFVSVTGAVRKPGSVPLRAGMRLTEALREAGGPAANGDFTRIEIRSVVGGRNEKVNLLALLSGKGKDPILMVGDTIVVPQVRAKGNE